MNYEPLSDDELRDMEESVTVDGFTAIWTDAEVARLLATIRDRDATIKRRGELIRHQAEMRYEATDSCQMCREIKAIVAGLEQKQ